MKPNKIRVRLSKQYNNFFIIIGFILSAVTFGIVFYLFYSNFFEREDYLTRKRLLKWIKENKLPDYLYIKELNLYYWNIGAIEINLSNEQQVFVNFSCNDMLCRSVGSIMDKRNYKQIKHILLKTIGEEK